MCTLARTPETPHCGFTRLPPMRRAFCSRLSPHRGTAVCTAAELSRARNPRSALAASIENDLSNDLLRRPQHTASHILLQTPPTRYRPSLLCAAMSTSLPLLPTNLMIARLLAQLKDSDPPTPPPSPPHRRQKCRDEDTTPGAPCTPRSCTHAACWNTMSPPHSHIHGAIRSCACGWLQLAVHTPPPSPPHSPASPPRQDGAPAPYTRPRRRTKGNIVDAIISTADAAAPRHAA